MARTVPGGAKRSINAGYTRDITGPVPDVVPWRADALRRTPMRAGVALTSSWRRPDVVLASPR
ncbi:hypothetical protein [Streptomyces sp. B21-101]|uniref:hypothetical protein n=1 Tax=Streptomyces sp. B21-101 TaxID=3039415 RepID=UPI002FF4293C